MKRFFVPQLCFTISARVSHSCMYFPLTPQDQLSADMYSFASKEADYARYYVMVSQRREHLTSLASAVAFSSLRQSLG